MPRKIFFFISLYLFLFTLLSAQTAPGLIKEGAPNVFVDCHCDKNYIKEQIPIVNYVVDRKDADVHILFTDQRTGSGGREYYLLFKGQYDFAGINDTVKYSTNQTQSTDEARNVMVDALKAGLTKYIYRSKIAGQMKIIYTNDNESSKTEEVKDDWNFWVFRTSVRTSFNGQQTTNNSNFEGSFSANRVTEDLKLNFSLWNQYNESNYDYEDEKITSITRSQNFSSSLIKAIDDNWSWGIWASANKSTYGNIKLGLNASPGIEYNFFPYSEANQRQLRIEYRINSRYNRYDSETIFLKTEEKLLSHSIHVSLELIETWGNAGMGLNYSNYLHDFNLYSLGANGFISWKMVKGLSIDLSGRYSKINNQIALPRGDASLEEVLLHRKEIKTQYSYNFSIGLSYTFGSIYNNAVNPRFD